MLFFGNSFLFIYSKPHVPPSSMARRRGFRLLKIDKSVRSMYIPMSQKEGLFPRIIDCFNAYRNREGKKGGRDSPFGAKLKNWAGRDEMKHAISSCLSLAVPFSAIRGRDRWQGCRDRRACLRRGGDDGLHHNHYRRPRGRVRCRAAAFRRRSRLLRHPARPPSCCRPGPDRQRGRRACRPAGSAWAYLLVWGRYRRDWYGNWDSWSSLPATWPCRRDSAIPLAAGPSSVPADTVAARMG